MAAEISKRAVLVSRNDHAIALVVWGVVDVAEVVGAARGVEDQGTTVVGEGVRGVGELGADGVECRVIGLDVAGDEAVFFLAPRPSVHE